MSDELLARLDKRVANTGTEHPEAAARIRAQAARITELENEVMGLMVESLRADPSLPPAPAAGPTIYAARDEHVDALRGPLDAQPNYDPVAAAAYAQEMGLPTEFDPAAESGEVSLPWSKRVLETGRLVPDAQTPKNLAALLDHQNKIIADLRRKLHDFEITDQVSTNFGLQQENEDLRRELAESQSALDSWIKLGERALKGVTERAERAERERDAWEKRSGQYMDERDAAEDLAREEAAKLAENFCNGNPYPTYAAAIAREIRSTITDPDAVKRTLEDAARYKARRHAIYLTRVRCQISLPKPSEDEFNAEYDAGCDKEREGYIVDHRGVYVKAARKGEEGK